MMPASAADGAPLLPPAGATRTRARRVLALLALGAAAAVLTGVLAGSVAVPADDLLLALLGRAGEGTLAASVASLRLPRVLAAFSSGGLLAVAGAMMQVLLGNPLGDPYVLGISGGAAVGALLCMAAGIAWLPTEAGALAGAACALALVLAFARPTWRHGAAGATRLLLTGVVLASGWSAVLTLVLTLAPEPRLRGMMFWLMGDLAGSVAWQPAALGLLLLLGCLRPLAADMNALLRGAVAAQALGVEVARRRLQLCVLASLATAVAVTTAGTVGFVGLLVPHALRLRIGNDQRLLLPASALLGGTLLTLADTAARTALAPLQLPVGVLTALAGVPVFLWLLSRRPPA